VLKEALKDLNLRDFIIELNQDQLFEKGQTSTGRSLGEYSAFTIKLKQEKGQRIDHVTLKDTGEFYETFHIVVAQDGSYFEIIGDGDKDDKNLFDVYGEDVVGLDEESRNTLIRTKLYFKTQQYVREQIARAA